MSVHNRELEKEVAKSIIKLIKARDTINTMLKNKSFIKDKMDDQFLNRIVSSCSAINDFLRDLTQKLNCSLAELETVIIKTENLFEIANEDIEKLIDFMSKKEVIWKHILVGLGVASLTALTAVTGGASLPLVIGSSSGLGGLAALLSVVYRRAKDDLGAFFANSRFDDIEYAYNLYSQYIKYGKNPTFTKVKIYFKEMFSNFCRSWKWQTS